MSGDRAENTSARNGSLVFGQSTEGGSHLGSSTAAELVGKRGKRGGEIGAPPSFLDKVCSILDEPKLAEHITWNQEGDGIVIREMDKFASEVLPLYFKHSNYQSFVRQLNIYGFHKTSHNEQSCEFKQPYFRRDQRHLMGLIRRKGHGSSVSTKQQREHHHVHEASDGIKEIVDRIYGEMRRLCNRVSQLEAEMGLINERHDALKLENQALWGLVIEEGSESFARRATEALEKLARTFSLSCATSELAVSAASEASAL